MISQSARSRGEEGAKPQVAKRRSLRGLPRSPACVHKADPSEDLGVTGFDPGDKVALPPESGETNLCAWRTLPGDWQNIAIVQRVRGCDSEAKLIACCF